MGNTFGGREKMAKVMKVDGSTFKVSPPAQAVNVLRHHPGHALLDADKVRRLGLWSRPLDPDAPLKGGKLYFLVEHHRLRPRPRPDHRRPSRQAWSGELQLGARERLESLRLSRRSVSDVARLSCSSMAEAETTEDGIVRLKVRLPKAQVDKLMRESQDAAEAAQRIMQLCTPKGGVHPFAEPRTPTTGRKERSKFPRTPEDITSHD